MIQPTWEIVHWVATSATSACLEGALDLIRRHDRTQWFPSLMVRQEPPSHPRVWAVDEARRFGVPVMCCRGPRGRPYGDLVRAVLDERFHLRNTNAVVLHLHTDEAGTCLGVRLLGMLVPRIAIVESRYEASERFREVRSLLKRGARFADGTVPIVQLYLDALGPSRGAR